MTVDEGSRRRLHDRLEEVLGMGHGDVLMDHLPSAGWGELATRRDVDELAATTRHELTALEQRLSHRLDRMDDRLTRFAEQVDERFARVEERFARVDERFARAEEHVDGRFARVEERFARVDEQFAQLEERFARQTAEITAAFRGEITTAMTLQIRQTVFAIVGVLLAVAALMAALLGLG
jgi:acyl carrier protein phosphodiesterase